MAMAYCLHPSISQENGTNESDFQKKKSSLAVNRDLIRPSSYISQFSDHKRGSDKPLVSFQMK